MKNAILIHGSCDEEEYFSDKYPSLSNSYWLPWLQKQLLMRGVLTQTPEFPEAYKPDYVKWKKEFERYEIGKETILVGHSCGGGFLTRWLSENNIKVGKLVLVAPWLDPSKRRTKDFFDFEIDTKIQERVREIHILISEDEETEGVAESVKSIIEKFPKAKRHVFKDKGHFTFEEMKTDKFPELLEIIVEKADAE